MWLALGAKLAAWHVHAPSVPAWADPCSHTPLGRLPLQLCRGSGLVFPERPKQAGKPPELQRRLDELRARLEQQQYDRMVADVTHVGAAHMRALPLGVQRA